MARTRDGGFALVLALIVVLIVGVLSAVVVSRYSLGPLQPGVAPEATSGGAAMAAAKTVEAKVIAGGLWAAVQASAMSVCGTPVAVHGSFDRAGLTGSGVTAPPRWSVASGGATLVADCRTGAYTASTPTLFTVEGTAADVTRVRVQLHVDSTRRSSQLLCSTDGGAAFGPC